MATNDFKPFAVGSNANVTSQDDYEALAALASGFQAGKASSAQVNKALRQGTVMASVIAQFIASVGGVDVADDGDIDGLVSKLVDALHTNANPFPIGMPFFWPSAKMPNELLPEWAGMEFLKWNGASFSASKYPKLALVIPSLTLVEARGEFPRIWDDGRGVDSGRGLLSTQGHGMPKLAGNFQSYDIGGYEGASGIFSASKFSDYIAAPNGGQGDGTDIRVSMDSSIVIPQANEVRPRNIAFNFLVRAK